MTSYFWNSGNGHWQVAADWFPNGVPGQNDNGTIGENGFPTDVTVTSDANATVGTLIVDAGSTLDIDGGTTFNAINGESFRTGFIFQSIGLVAAQDGATFELGEDGHTETFDDGGTIELLGNTEITELEIAGTVNLTFGGLVSLAGSNPGTDDAVVSDGTPATLNLEDATTIAGAGTIGDSNLTLDNVSGTIDANAPVKH